ncbi:MAG TPA: DMT family transporter [Actinomycetota bacterium]
MKTAGAATEGAARAGLPTPYLWLMVGVGAASVSPILIRYASGADALAISWWRCALGAVVLFPFAWPKLRTMPRDAFVLPAVAGVFLAVHFATWIASLEYTSVAASVVLVSTTPIFVALTQSVVFKEAQGRLVWTGIGLGLVGTALVGGGDLGGQSLTGDALALAGGAGAAGYVLAGQRSRQTLGILEYAVVTYGVAAALLLVASVAQSTELTGYPAGTWWAIAGLVVGPQLLGHTVINFVLADIDATTVSMSIMAEPIVATILAYLLFSEVPSALVYPGGAAILFGIYQVTRATRIAPVVVE